MRITHDGEVNKARHMPQNEKIIATKPGGSGVRTTRARVIVCVCHTRAYVPIDLQEVFVFDTTTFKSEPAEKCLPTVRDAGRATEAACLTLAVSRRCA